MSRTLITPVAVLLGVVLLVAGLAGGATAAKLITGKQIKNGTVTTADVKNESLRSADVRNGSLSGVDVKAGSLGADRLAPAARNLALEDDGNSQDLPSCDDTGLEPCAPLASVTLTPGTWVVTGLLSVKNLDNVPNPLSDTCGLFSTVGGHPDARFPLAALGDPGETQTLTLQDVVTVPSGTLPISLRCTEMPGGNLRVSPPKVTALRVS